ncbi:unnamed protein product [Ilex paraguariensis]|uniref:Uncharacterized protein n=1 Tax=Ilex paraguariensis TaxID=185542 RepID=A0ABC8V4D5_9AQUA
MSEPYSLPIVTMNSRDGVLLEIKRDFRIKVVKRDDFFVEARDIASSSAPVEDDSMTPAMRIRMPPQPHLLHARSESSWPPRTILALARSNMTCQRLLEPAWLHDQADEALGHLCACSAAFGDNFIGVIHANLCLCAVEVGFIGPLYGHS